MYFQFKTREVTYELKFDNPLNFIIGDSASGKTELLKLYEKAKGVGVVTDASEVITEIPDRYVSDIKPGAMVMVDLDNYAECDRIDSYVNQARDDVFTVFIGRKWIRRVPVAITNTFILMTSKGVSKNILFCNKFVNVGTFDNAYVEDSTSGLRFIESALRGISVESSYGASGMVKKDALKSNRLCIFDELGFGGYIEEFLDRAPKDMPYIAWKSFEGFLLEELFGETVSYKFFNAEDNAEKTLNSLCNSYAKSTWTAEVNCPNCPKLCKCKPYILVQHSQYNWILDNKQSGMTKLFSAVNIMKDT